MTPRTWAMLAAALMVTGLWTLTVGAGVRESTEPNCAPDATDCPPSTSGISAQGKLLVAVGSLLMVSSVLSLIIARRTRAPPPPAP